MRFVSCLMFISWQWRIKRLIEFTHNPALSLLLLPQTPIQLSSS